jgi:predicted nucleic-acid-binding protein
MIALDTNVLVRLLVADDPGQAARAFSLLEEVSEKGEKCLITDPVLCELEWVLESAYNASRTDVVCAIQHLLTQDTLQLSEPSAVQEALDRFQRGKGDFSDYLLGIRGHALGARTTFTFDRALGSADDFTLL